MLKKIEAIIREDKLNDVKEALEAIGIKGMNIFEIRGRGRQGGITLAGRSGSYQVDMLPKIQVNIVLSEHNLEETVAAIGKAAHTGTAGDGLIFIYPLEEVIRIRTGERGHDAVMYPGTSTSARGAATPASASLRLPASRGRPRGDGRTTRSGRPLPLAPPGLGRDLGRRRGGEEFQHPLPGGGVQPGRPERLLRRRGLQPPDQGGGQEHRGSPPSRSRPASARASRGSAALRRAMPSSPGPAPA